MKRQCLWFEEPGRVSVREEALEAPGSREILLQSIVSAISPGTEMLFFKGQLEEGAMVDATMPDYRREVSYPLRYGYSTVGKIVKAGDGVDPGLVGRLAFAFMPHASASCVPADLAIPVPDGITAEEAAFLASAETAVNLVLDCRPLLGERAGVFGLGVIGLLTAGLLARFPLACLSGWDLHAIRRDAAGSLGVTAADPNVNPPGVRTEDFAVEASGSADGFRAALSSCGFSGRLIVGSWYGKTARGQAFDAFDTLFHRNRVRIIPSQVSTIDPSLTGRWDRARRLASAWDAIRFLRPGRLITHRVPFTQAADAYRLISGSPEETIQVLLVHESAETPLHAHG